MLHIPDTIQNRADYAKFAAEILRKRSSDWCWQKLAVLGCHTTEFFNPYLVVEAGRHGIGLDIWNGPYAQIEQQVLNSSSGLYASGPDVVLVLPDLQEMVPELVFRYLALQSHEVEALRENFVYRIRGVIESIRKRSSMRILLGNLTPPLWVASGISDPMLHRPFANLLAEINQQLGQICRDTSGAQLFDLDGLARDVGLRQWRDDRMALLARAPYSGSAMSAVGRLVGRHLRSALSTPKKCLVLDMDNTLWGGVLGEGGVDGIQLGPDYPGNVFVDFQRRVLALRDRGVLLAAASKNNAADVEQVLAEHPSSVLKREHFSAFEVHWEDKATSLRRIAKVLNIGLDALVFFDDNPVEREWVKNQLSEVMVIEVPKSPMLYAPALEQSLAFDTFVLTEEDRKRAELYEQESSRSQAQAGATSMEDFIRALEMKVTVGLFDEANLPRIVQLLGKTNQFNLTTRRHDQARLTAMMNEGAIGVWAKIRDRFGDSGLVAVAMAVKVEDEWEIDSFLMSCRVIGRGVETAVLAVLERLVRQRGGGEIYGTYLETAKNQPAANFFERHGYSKVSSSEDRWHLSLDELRSLPDSFVVSCLTQ